MEQFQLLCQVRQILSPVTLDAPDALMPGHVLNLPDIVCLEPVHYYTCADLAAVFNFSVDSLCCFNYLTDHVTGFLRREEVRRLKVPFFK